MEQKILYDISKVGIASSVWLLTIWGMGGLTASLVALSSKPAGLGERLKSYLGGAIGIFFFAFAMYFLTQGWNLRNDCKEEYASGNFETAQGQVVSLEKSGRTTPYRYSFSLGGKPFEFGNATIGSCGVAAPPQAKFTLTEGQSLTIQFNEDRIFKVIENRVSKD
jgi:hypothetical protein